MGGARASAYNEKRRLAEEFRVNKELDSGGDSIDFSGTLQKDVSAAAMGKGDDELFERKLTKEEKKAAAKAAREAKRKAKGKTKKSKKGGDDEEKKEEVVDISKLTGEAAKEAKRELALEELAKKHIIVTYEAKKGKLHANTRDINVSGVSVHFHSKPMILDSDISISYGNRYGFIGPNGSGKSTILKAIAARAIPIPDALDIYFLDSEYPARDDITALQAVCEANDEVHILEKRAEDINTLMADLALGDEENVEEKQMEMTSQLEAIYERLDELDATTAEVRASTILHGLGFTKKMQGMKTREFSGGWRMRVALARALFLKPEFLLLDERKCIFVSTKSQDIYFPNLDHYFFAATNHLDMEAVLWLEDYLKEWNKILFFICHSQDFMNNVCTHIVRLDQTYKKLHYYTGNYDSYVNTRRDQDMVQMRQYEAEQKDIAEIKEFIARFGHGTSKMVKQAHSREKLLQKKLEAGLTPKPEPPPSYDWSFPDAGQLPVPVLQIQDVSFNYPGGDLLYDHVDFGVDLDTRVALVGPNGAGKTTLFKLMVGDLNPTDGAIKRNMHLRISRFTQHFEDVLDLSMSAIDFFKTKIMPEEPTDRVRALLGRYGTGGTQQVQEMSQLSAGQKARIVFAIIAHERPHLVMLDERKLTDNQK